MKKFSIVVVAALLLTTTLFSCNGKSGKSSTAVDTLSVMLGEMYGYGVSANASQMDSNMNRESFLRGMEFIMNVDTSDVAYMQGVGYAMNLQRMFTALSEQNMIDIDKAKFMLEFKKAFLSDSLMDATLLQGEVMNLMQRITKEAKEKDPKAIANRQAGEAFIAEAMKNDSTLKRTESGLVYKVVKEGNGKLFKTTDRIMAKYKGTHIDGKVFDETKDNAREMNPMGVIQGMKEAFLMMSPGAKYILYIPGDLAYGVEGRGAAIGPNETLIFELETIEVKKDNKK